MRSASSRGPGSLDLVRAPVRRGRASRRSCAASSARTAPSAQPDLRCLLLLGLRNTSTGSPWPVSSNPAGPLQPGAGLQPRPAAVAAGPREHRGADVLRARGGRPSAATTFVFSDGAVTTLNNPALQLVLMATLPAYQPRLADRPRRAPAGQRRDRHHRAGSGRPARSRTSTCSATPRPVPEALIHSAGVQHDVLCRVLGECRSGARARQRARRPGRWRRAARRAAVQLRPVRRRDAPRQPRAARGRPPVHREPGPDRRRRLHRGDVRVRPGHLHPGRPGPLRRVRQRPTVTARSAEGVYDVPAHGTEG